MRSFWIVLSLAALSSCSFDASVSSGAGNGVADGDAAPPPGGEVVGACIPGDAPLCDGDNLLECNADGELVQFACVLGCLSSGEPRCRFAVPRAPVGAGPLDTAIGTIDTSVLGSLIFDTESGEISRRAGGVLRAAGVGPDASSGIDFALASQAGAPDIGVFTLASVLVRAGDSLRAQGDNAFAIVSAGDVIISGIIDVDGGAATCAEGAGACPGPGADRGGTGGGSGNHNGHGPGAGGGGSDPGSGAGESGGGGAGFGTPGARGGDGLSQSNQSVQANGGAGGNTVDDALLTPLRGGSGGGGGAREGTNYVECTGTRDGGKGGGGGGALQLFSRTRIDLADSGGECGIRAGGGGGGEAGCGAGGGGGGSGGALLLEAPRVDVAASCYLTANGGAGSGGHESVKAEGGGMGGAAQASDGNAFVGNPSGDGGDGCYLAVPAETGGDSAYQAGGGGGGDGRIRVHTANGTSFFTAGSASPSPSQGAVSPES